MSHKKSFKLQKSNLHVFASDGLTQSRSVVRNYKRIQQKKMYATNKKKIRHAGESSRVCFNFSLMHADTKNPLLYMDAAAQLPFE